MSMKAQIRTDAQGNITVFMNGGLDFENTIPLKKELEILSKSHPTASITIDMGSLDFVGSSGIGFFVETVQILNAKKTQIKLSNVKSEFLRVFKLYDFNAEELIEAQFENDETENLHQKFSNKKKTYQV